MRRKRAVGNHISNTTSVRTSAVSSFVSKRSQTGQMKQTARRGRPTAVSQSRVSTRQSSRHAAPAAASAAPAENGVKEEDQCIICLDAISQPKKLGCGHTFCSSCIAEYFRRCQEKCPTCGKVFGVLRGNQPEGRFKKTMIQSSLPGYERCKTIQIVYTIPDGIQTVGFTNWNPVIF